MLEASIRSSWQGTDRTNYIQAILRVGQKFEGFARHSEYNGHELYEYGMFFKRFTRPPFRNMMSDQDIANRNLIPRALNRPLVLRKPLQLSTNILCDQITDRSTSRMTFVLTVGFLNSLKRSFTCGPVTLRR